MQALRGVSLKSLKIELVEALGEGSPIERFMVKNPSGGMHHICFEAAELGPTVEILSDNGIRILGAADGRTGAHGNPVIFAHPSDLCGVLTEFEEVAGPK